MKLTTATSVVLNLATMLGLSFDLSVSTDMSLMDLLLLLATLMAGQMNNHYA